MVMSDVMIIGNAEYGLSKSLKETFPQAEFYSRSTGYNLSKRDIREQVAKLSIKYKTVILVSALGDFSQTLLCEVMMKEWWSVKHSGYLIALGSSADTPVKATNWIYPTEKRALRSYCRQLSQHCASETNWGMKVTYIAPGNLHTPKQDDKLPGVKKLDCGYVAKTIGWLTNQPSDVNISELCLDRIISI